MDDTNNLSERKMPITINVGNQDQWDIVSPLAEMEVTKRGRCLNPPLVFVVKGLEHGRKYFASIVFQRKDEEHKYDKETKCWKPWRHSQPLPDQTWTLNEMTGGEMMANGVHFSSMLITSQKGTEAPDRAVLQSLHVYSPLVVITPADNPEEMRQFGNDRLDFVVVTKTSERLKEQRALLGPKPKEPSKKKRSAELVGNGAPKTKRARKIPDLVEPLDDEFVEIQPDAYEKDENIAPLPYIHQAPRPIHPNAKVPEPAAVPEDDHRFDDPNYWFYAAAAP